MEAQVPDVEETTKMDDFKEIINSAEISVDIPGPE